MQSCMVFIYTVHAKNRKSITIRNNNVGIENLILLVNNVRKSKKIKEPCLTKIGKKNNTEKKNKSAYPQGFNKQIY